MNILIVGSLRQPKPSDPPEKNLPNIEEAKKQYEERFPQFVAACRAIGVELAHRGHTIYVGGPNLEDLKERCTVTSHIVEGANLVETKNEQKHTVIFYSPQEPEAPDTTPKIVDSPHELGKLPNINLKKKNLGRGTYKARFIPNLNEIDGVLLIGGGDGTATVGYAAYSLRKPIVTLTGLDGAAQQIAEDILYDSYDRLARESRITATELGYLDVAWDKEKDSQRTARNRTKASHIVDLLEKLTKDYSLVQKRMTRPVWFTMGAMVLLLAVWLRFYLTGANCSTTEPDCVLYVQIAFFTLLFSSSILGTGLRILTSYQQMKIARLTVTGLCIEATISLLLAFGLVLIYLIGSISFTGGEVVILDPATKAFSTISISMSLLGLTAGYLLPLQELSEQLEGLMTQDTNVDRRSRQGTSS